MAAGPLRGLLASAAMVGATTLGPLTGNAVAQEAPKPILVNAASTTQQSPIVQAGMFAEEDRNNIAVMMYYGLGNRTAPDAAGQMVVDQLEAASVRAKFPIDAQYFYQRVDNFEGIVLDVVMVGSSFEGVDIREAVKSPQGPDDIVFSDRVIERLQTVNKTLDLASLDF